MRVTIVVDDNIVLVDGKARSVDCSPLVKDGLHAVQWRDVVGEEEYRSEFDAATKTIARKPNAVIADFKPYESYVEQWRVENAKQELVEAAQQRQIANDQEAVAKNKLRQEAWSKLPQEVRQQLLVAQQEGQQERAELAERQRLEAWLALDPDEQRRLIAEAQAAP